SRKGPRSWKRDCRAKSGRSSFVDSRSAPASFRNRWRNAPRNFKNACKAPNGRSARASFKKAPKSFVAVSRNNWNVPLPHGRIPLLGQEGGGRPFGFQGVVDCITSLPSRLREAYHPGIPGGLHPLLK